MSDEPAFEIKSRDVLALASTLEKAGARSLEDVFPAALVAPTWRALLESGSIKAPARVDLDRVEVLLVGPNALELRVPVRTKSSELVKVLTVWVKKWSSTGQLAEQLDKEAQRLADALAQADAQATFSHYTGVGQKPHNRGPGG